MDFSTNLFAGWCGFLAGAVSGAGIGLFFHNEIWLGGYGSFRRRILRLGHIACFGIGLINILFTLSTTQLRHTVSLQWGSAMLLIAMVAMPLTCFLSAWKDLFRHLFVIPVVATSAGVVAILVSFR